MLGTPFQILLKTSNMMNKPWMSRRGPKDDEDRCLYRDAVNLLRENLSYDLEEERCQYISF